MESRLQYFLLNYKRLLLPSIGMLQLSENTVTYDVTSREFVEKQQGITLTNNSESFDQELLGFLAIEFGLQEDQAFEKLQKYTDQIINQIRNIGYYDWNPLGKFFTNGSEIEFIQANFDLLNNKIFAEKISKKGSIQTILVGDKEIKTELHGTNEITSPVPGKNTGWWILPLILTVIAIALIIWKILSTTPLQS